MPTKNHPNLGPITLCSGREQTGGEIACSGFFVGDEVSSDDIIGPDYLSFDLAQADERKMLATYAFAGVVEKFGEFMNPQQSVSAYEIIVAGERFGRGSGRRQPAVALNEAGIKIILAKSYGEAFYRTCVNEGTILPLILVADEFDWSTGRTGMQVCIDVMTRTVEIEEIGIRTTFEDPGVTLEIAIAGGLQGFLSGLGK